MNDFPAAVLWDMDGTLVDTEPYWFDAEFDLVAEFDGTWTDADALSLVGFDLLASAHELRTRGGVRLEPVQIVERLLDGVVSRVAERAALAARSRRAAGRVYHRRDPVRAGHDVVAPLGRRRDRVSAGRVVRGLDHR